MHSEIFHMKSNQVVQSLAWKVCPTSYFEIPIAGILILNGTTQPQHPDASAGGDSSEPTDHHWTWERSSITPAVESSLSDGPQSPERSLLIPTVHREGRKVAR